MMKMDDASMNEETKKKTPTKATKEAPAKAEAKADATTEKKATKKAPTKTEAKKAPAKAKTEDETKDKAEPKKAKKASEKKTRVIKAVATAEAPQSATGSQETMPQPVMEPQKTMPQPTEAPQAPAAKSAVEPTQLRTYDRASLSKLLKNYFGFDTFKGDQEAIIQNVLNGNDTFVLMPTGGGKSLCYQLPSLLMDGVAIVISPLIALMKNQVDAIRNYSEEDGVAHFINSSLNKAAIDQVKEDIISGKTKLLYVAPESLTKEENVEFLRTVRISFYAIDEAHCISEWGHDFRPEYRKIRPIIDQISRAPIIALTATATNKVRDDIKKNLGIPDAHDFKSSFNRPNLYYEVRPKTKNVDRDIIRFIKANAGKSGIIYCLSRKKVEELAEILRANDIPAAAYHAGMESAVRTQTQDDFLMEKIDVIVATIAFGMGIDKPDVRYVIHYDIPKSLEGYYQETGRAGATVAKDNA